MLYYVCVYIYIYTQNLGKAVPSVSTVFRQPLSICRSLTWEVGGIRLETSSRSVRDHTNHPHPHLQTCQNFEVPNRITNEPIQLLTNLNNCWGWGRGWFVWSPSVGPTKTYHRPPFTGMCRETRRGTVSSNSRFQTITISRVFRQPLIPERRQGLAQRSVESCEQRWGKLEGSLCTYGFAPWGA